MTIVSLDAMGGDAGPDVTIPAAEIALEANPDLKLILVGDQELLTKRIADLKPALAERVSIRHASQKVEMDESPSSALRGKKDSSMRVAINLVKEGEAGACVSAGNTGALMATARFVLKTLPGIDRPAICTSIPSVEGHNHILDLGANVDSSSDHLFQFAVMGSVLASAVDNIESPRVALLNIGEEEIKGNDQVKRAASILAASELNYIGYIEGDQVFKGGSDVVVCDGFVGNVMLKTTEGVAKMISHFMKEAFMRGPLSKLAAVIAMPVLKSFRKRIDPRRYNGASLLGLRGIVVKSHGGADAFSFANAIKIATLEVSKSVPERIHSELETLLTRREAV
ncbi:phosphate acyltransferase PlsX [Candidatus Reidiella endopervernicosa]|nr:phosphate acyltransferase PlsX [Candidatus Reidiella endopervernicosa]QKQ26899.1 phosphate acyltransferase PlsX [Candidatus Reidiella endopervernicosa]